MRYPRFHSIVVLLALLNCFPSLMFALGGTGPEPVDEAEISIVLYVDGALPTNGNGAQGSPFNKIQSALNQAVNLHNAAGEGVRILIAPHVYREGTAGAATMLQLPSPSTSAPIIIEGMGWSEGVHTGDVVISGSEVWSDWSNNGNGTWSKAWTYDWGVGPNNTGGGNPPEPMLRYELVHVNGNTYYQMMGEDDPNHAHLTAEEGTFWVDESANLITLRPPASLGNLNAATVEVTTKRRLMHHWRPQASLSPTRVVFRNLVFTHGTGGMNSGAVVLQNMIGLIIEDCVFTHNKQLAASISGESSTMTLRKTDFVYNGEMGAGIQGVNVLVEDVRFNHNSRFSDVIKYYGWGYGGIKIGHSSNLTFRRVQASNNYGMGLWFDSANVNCLVEDSRILDNTSQGIWSENNNRNNIPALNTTPTVVVRDTYIAGNYKRSPQASASGGGFYITESENIVIENSVLYDNNAQFRVSDGPGRGPTNNISIQSSILASRIGEIQHIYAVGYGTTGWNEFFDTLSPNTGDNDYYFTGLPYIENDVVIDQPQPAPDTISAFRERSQGLTRNLAGWKQLHQGSGADQDSRWLQNYVGQPLITARRAASYREDDGETVEGFILTRVARDYDSPLTVSYSVSGTAQPGVHYQAFSGEVTFAVGSPYAVIPFTSIPQAEDFGELTVEVTVAQTAQYRSPSGSASFILGKSGTASLPRISVEATQALASETGPTSGIFTLTRTGSTAQVLTVNYSIGGTAVPTRYQSLSGSVSFPVGAETATIPVMPIDDAVPQLSETIVLSISSGSHYIADPELPDAATVTILDNDIVMPALIEQNIVPSADTVTIPVTLNNPHPTEAQTFTVTLPDFSSYTWADSTQPDGPSYTWTDIASLGTQITELGFGGSWTTSMNSNTRYENGQSGTEGGIPLGFNFPLYGLNYDRLWVSSKGYLLFYDRNAFQTSPNAHPLPATTSIYTRLQQAFLVFYWDDLTFKRSGSNQSTAHFYRPDADTFILQFKNVHRNRYLDQGLLTLQVVIKSSGEVTYHYRTHTIPTPQAYTVGIQSHSAVGSWPNTVEVPVRSLQVAHGSDYITENLTVRISPQVAWLSADTPVSQFTFTVPANSSETFNILLNPDGLDLNSYLANIQISSDLATQPSLHLPVTLNVTDAPVPNSPLNFSVSALSTSAIQLTWTDNADNEEGYRVEGADSANGSFTVLAELAPGSTAFTHTGLSHDTTRYYRVHAYNVHGPSNNTPTLSAKTLGTPNSPANLSAAAISPSQIQLNWTDQSTDETGFIVEASNDGVAFLLIATLPANTLSYEETGLSAGQIRYYRVAASNSHGVSAYTNTATATTPTLAAYHGTLGFSTTSVSINENEASLTLTVNRSGGSHGAVSVAYASTDGTAITGLDYTAVSGILNWGDGDTAAKTVTLPLLLNTQATTNRQLTLTLSSPSGGATLGTHTIEVTLIKLNPPPQITSNPTLALGTNNSVNHFLKVDQETRAFFSEPPYDTYPGQAGAGWENSWTIYSTTLDTAAGAELLTESPLLGGGAYLQFYGTAMAAGKRTLIGRSYGDDEARRIARNEPHRIVLLLRLDDLSGFSSTGDRIYLWDRPDPSNADHNDANMTWGFVSAGAPREWRFYGTSMSSSGVAITEGHSYRFVIDVDPANNRWKFSLMNLDTEQNFTTPDWVPFRNEAENTGTVGGHIHAGFYLQTAPQTARLSLDTMRVTAGDFAFRSQGLPLGVSFDSALGILTGNLSGSGSFQLGAENADGVTWQTVTYGATSAWTLWQQNHFSTETLADSNLEQNTWGTHADPDGDGIINLLEYALGGNPEIANSAPPPQLIVVNHASQDYLAMQIEKNPEASDISYTVETSINLESWSGLESDIVVVSETSTQLIVRTANPLGNEPKRFLRLRISK